MHSVRTCGGSRFTLSCAPLVVCDMEVSSSVLNDHIRFTDCFTCRRDVHALRIQLTYISPVAQMCILPYTYTTLMNAFYFLS